eukprot:768563-Hanusia_phi.AAC.2
MALKPGVFGVSAHGGEERLHSALAQDLLLVLLPQPQVAQQTAGSLQHQALPGMPSHRLQHVVDAAHARQHLLRLPSPARASAPTHLVLVLHREVEQRSAALLLHVRALQVRRNAVEDQRDPLVVPDQLPALLCHRQVSQQRALVTVELSGVFQRSKPADHPPRLAMRR